MAKVSLGSGLDLAANVLRDKVPRTGKGQAPGAMTRRMGDSPIPPQGQYKPPELSVPKPAFFGTTLVSPLEVVTVVP